MKSLSDKNCIFIKPIKDEGYNALLKETIDFLDEILIYGQYTVGLTQEKNQKKYSDTVIAFLLHSSLETLDGIKALFAASSITVSKTLVRNLFEHMLYFDYIFLDNNLIVERALSYHVIDILKRIKSYKLLDFNDTTYENERRIIGEDNLSNIPQQDILKRIKNLEAQFTKYPEYANVYNEVLNNKRYAKSKYIPEWYNLYSDAESIRGLSKLLKMEKFYITLYSDFSNKVHPGDAMRAFIVNKDKSISVRNPKIPYNTLEVSNIISNSLTFSSSIYSHVIKHFMPSDDFKNYSEWHFDMRKRCKILEEHWENVHFQSK
jgi:hypothetical protein